jgi:tRNA pseudouridine55 synthase
MAPDGSGEVRSVPEDGPMTSGLTLVHKPVGVTSFSLVQAFRDELAGRGPVPPVCHGGTLDPFAEGLLLLLSGPMTRLMDELHKAPKEYVATVVWGRETDTGDLHGTPTLQEDASTLTPSGLDAALAPFLGWTDQVPPATSAKKIGGEPAYKKAHRGETVVLPPSRVFLHEARWLSHDLPHASRLWMRVRGGFYVRSLARDLGRRLGCGAHVSALARPAIGPWPDPGPGERPHHAGTALLPWLPTRELNDAEVGALRQDAAIAPGVLRPGAWAFPRGFPSVDDRALGLHQGRFVGLLAREKDDLRPLALWRGSL